MKTIIVTTIIVAISICYGICDAAPPPEVRVLVVSGSEIAIDGGAERIGILPMGEGPRGEIVVGSHVVIMAAEGGILVDRIPVGRAIVLRTIGQRYAIGDRHFRGRIELIWKSPEKIIVVNHVPIEEYLAGLLGSEMYPGWPIEALKAQAVAARTYALHHSKAARDYSNRKDYDVMSTVHSQVYEGAHKAGFRAHDACKQTRGMALLRDGGVFSSYYHSCCGGRTEHAHNVWTNAKGPPQIEDRFCRRSPKRSWKLRVSRSELLRKLAGLGVDMGEIRGVSVEVEEDSPRNKLFVITDEIGTKGIPATELRRLLGYSKLKSTWFEARMDGDAIVFTGRGYGHGVGMCQWGAKGMADERFSYEEILKHYYPDAEVARVY